MEGTTPSAPTINQYDVRRKRPGVLTHFFASTRKKTPAMALMYVCAIFAVINDDLVRFLVCYIRRFEIHLPGRRLRRVAHATVGATQRFPGRCQDSCTKRSWSHHPQRFNDNFCLSNLLSTYAVAFSPTCMIFNMKLRCREEHSASVVLSWYTLGYFSGKKSIDS